MLDLSRPDQWECAPQVVTIVSKLAGKTDQELADDVRDLYAYHEPLTVPQRYDSRDSPHHRSRYDPLKQLSHHYLPIVGLWPLGWDGSDLEVSEAEMREAGMSPRGHRVP